MIDFIKNKFHRKTYANSATEPPIFLMYKSSFFGCLSTHGNDMCVCILSLPFMHNHNFTFSSFLTKMTLGKHHIIKKCMKEFSLYCCLLEFSFIIFYSEKKIFFHSFKLRRKRRRWRKESSRVFWGMMYVCVYIENVEIFLNIKGIYNDEI